MENEKSLEKKEDFTPFVLMDRLDDKLIIEELEARMPDVLTYHFKQKGQEVWGLSKAGVDEAKSELAKKGEVIRELEVDITSDGKFFYAKAKCGRFVVNRDGKEILLDTAYGFKRQAISYESGIENPFAFEQAGIKACRNASLRLIPKTLIQAVIEYAKEKGKVKEVIPEEIEPEPEKSSFNKNYEFLQRMAKAKRALGEEAYYEVLGSFGYEHANLIMPKDEQKILKAMKEKYQELIKKPDSNSME